MGNKDLENLPKFNSGDKSLQAEQERFLQTQRIARIGYWDWDLINNSFYCSDEMYSILGYTPGEQLPAPHTFLKHVHPDDQKYVQAALERAMVTGKKYQAEYRFHTVHGHEGWIYSRGKVVFENGSPVRIFGTTQDLTERKRLESLLEEERNFIAAVNDTIGYLVVVLDRAGKIIRYNRTCEIVTGLSFEEVKDRYYWDIFCIPEEVELYKAFFSSLAPENFPYEVESYQPARDGSMRILLWTSNVLLDQNGLIKNYIMTGSDITSRKETENALRELGERYRALIHAAPVAVISTDSAARVKSWSAAAEQVLGWSEKEVLDQEIFTLLQDNELMRPYAKKVLKKVIKGRSFTNIELRCSCRDGSPVHLVLSLAPLRNYTGEINGIVMVAADHTARKLAEETLQEERDKALKIHRRSLPEEFPVHGNFHLAAYYKPALELRGDFYNVVREGEQLIIYLTDVAGKGLDGVMLSVFIRETVESYAHSCGDDGSALSPTAALRHLLEQYRRENNFVSEDLSIFLAVLDLRTGELRYTSSGFCTAPLLATADRPAVELELTGNNCLYQYGANSCLVSSNLVAETPSFSGEGYVRLAPDSTLLFSTDGLMAQNCAGGSCKERVENVLNNCRHLPPELISRAVKDDCCEDLNEEDDIAFIVIQAFAQEQAMTLEVESDFTVIEETVDKVLAFISAHVVADTDLLDFHELLVNAIEHGNKRDGAKKVSIEVIVNTYYYKIIISDQGDGFNWRARLSKELDLEDYYERGRGIIMTKMMSDYLGYNERGNRVTLINYLQ